MAASKRPESSGLSVTLIVQRSWPAGLSGKDGRAWLSWRPNNLSLALDIHHDTRQEFAMFV